MHFTVIFYVFLLNYILKTNFRENVSNKFCIETLVLHQICTPNVVCDDVFNRILHTCYHNPIELIFSQA